MRSIAVAHAPAFARAALAELLSLVLPRLHVADRVAARKVTARNQAERAEFRHSPHV